jgi:hypothetical protein
VAGWSYRYWEPHTDANNVVYDLSHVHPLKYNLRLEATAKYEARNVPISVSFSSHTFTKSCAEADCHPQYSPPDDPRVFCSIRYELSKRLPELVTTLAGRHCYLHKHRDNNYIVVELAGLPPGSEYWIFFRLLPAGADRTAPSAVLVMVDSAFPGDPARAPYMPKPRKYVFNALIGMVLRNTRPAR